jgi:hypothetical protein
VGLDTFRLARSVGRGLTVGGSVTLFLTDAIGIGGDISYTGPAQDDVCEIVFRGTPSPGSAEARGFNDELCANISNRNSTLGAISLMVDAMIQPFPNTAIRPYIRFSAGITDPGRSSAEMSAFVTGPDIDGNGIPNTVDRPLILDDVTTTAGLTYGGGIGFMIPFSTGYVLRFEARDQLFHRAVPTGPANLLNVGPISKEWAHTPSFIVGIGVSMRRFGGGRRRLN